jgi:hypothetical protein
VRRETGSGLGIFVRSMVAAGSVNAKRCRFDMKRASSPASGLSHTKFLVAAEEPAELLAVKAAGRRHKDALRYVFPQISVVEKQVNTPPPVDMFLGHLIKVRNLEWHKIL